MVNVLSILLFILNKINSYEDQTKKKKCETYIATEFFWFAKVKERKIRTRNNGINKRNILSSLFFQCFFRFQLEMASFILMGKMVFFIFLTSKNGEILKF